jgi:uncharacterized protein YjeT (DUF2065 family)
MNKTRLSFYYVASYLLIGGIGLLLAPRLATTLLLSNANYDATILRLVGMLLTGLGLVIVQFIRLKVYDLYPSSLLVRAFFCICLTVFYLMSHNPFFLTILAIVMFGVVLTGLSLLADQKNRK